MKQGRSKHPKKKQTQSLGKETWRSQRKGQSQVAVSERAFPLRGEAIAFLLLRILLSLLLVLQGIASFFRGPLLWSVDQLAYAPRWIGVIWPAIGMVAIWFPPRAPLSRTAGRFLVNRCSRIILDRTLIAYVLVPLLGAAIFWIVRCKVHFLGDGWLHGGMVSHGLRFHGFDFLTYNLVARLFAALHHPVEADALRMFAYLSIASGALYLAAVAWTVRSLSRDRALRVLLYGLLVFFGAIQVFMGYVECYSILTVFMLLFVASVIGHYRSRLPIWIPGVAFGLGLMFHLDAMFLAPLLILPLAWPARHSPRSFIWRLIFLIGPIVAALGLAVAILILQGYNRNMFHYDFVLWRPGNALFVPFEGQGGLFSWQHWKDVLNLLLLLAPVPVVMLVLSAVLTFGKRRGSGEKQESSENNRDSVTMCKANQSDQRLMMLLLGANLWVLVLMLTLHMKQGVARDWDLFAAHATLVVLTAWFAWSRLVSGHLRDELAGATIITAFLLSLPWFWLNAGEARSVQWFQDITPGFPPYQKAYAHEELGNYYRNTGRPSEALKQYQSSFETFPGHGRFGAALGSFQYSEGMKDEALRTFRQVLAADSTQRIALELAARIHYERREYEATLLYARRLAKVGQERPLAAAVHGDAAETLGLFEEAVASYERALRGDPLNVELMCRIGRLYVRRGDFARAEQAFESALRLQPNSVPARMGLATAIWEPIARSRAAWTESATRNRLNLVFDILTQLISEGKSEEKTRAWHEEVRRALRGVSPAFPLKEPSREPQN